MEHKPSDVFKKPARTMIVGVGGAGLHVVNVLLKQDMDYPPMVVVDTDGRALEHSMAPQRLQIGTGVTEGLSTGGDADLGRRAANEDFVKIRELFSDTDMVLLVAGLGGGVGSGALPVLAQTARDEGALVISMVSMPLALEGQDRRDVADRAIELAGRASHTMICHELPEAKQQDDPDNQDAALPSVLDATAQLVGLRIRVLWKLLEQPGLFSVDFAGLRHVIQEAGRRCFMFTAEASGKNRASLIVKRIKQQMTGADITLEESGGVMLGFLGPEDLTLAEMELIVREITADMPAGTRRQIGVALESQARSTMQAIVLAGGKNEHKPEEPATPSDVTAGAKRPGYLKSPIQKEIEFDTMKGARGRFNNVEPTFHNGEDLDTPTYIRRGMKLSR